MRNHRRRNDAGMTLLELTIGLTVMGIFLTMFGSTMVQVYKSANTIENVSAAQSQINTAFLRLDRQVRYASAITVSGTTVTTTAATTTTTTDAPTTTTIKSPSTTPPGVVYTWVEFLTTNTTTDATKPWCTELRQGPHTPGTTDAGLLQSRTWRYNTAFPSPAPAWQTLAGSIVSPLTASLMFELDPQGTATSGHHQLKISLKSLAHSVSRESSYTFSAMNSDSSTPTTTVCTEGRGTE